MAILTWPAFGGFFFGEDFITRGLYLNSHENFFQAIFTPFTGFLRPSAVAWSIGTQLVLPWDPFLHHARNLLFDAVAVVLVHRILVELGLSRAGRLWGVAFFAVSRIHLTLVGYINCIDNVGTLLYQLVAILLLLRAQRSGDRAPFFLSLACAGLSCFARDLGCMIILPLLGIVWLSPEPGSLLMGNKRRALAMSAAFVGIFLAYLAVRAAIVGLPFAASEAGPTSAYALRLNPSRFFTVPLASLGMVLGAPILSEPQNVGSSDFTTLLGLSGSAASVARGVFLAAFSLALVVGSAVIARKRPVLLFPILWIAGFCGPLVFIGAFQAYYTYEASAATAILVACIISSRSVSRLTKTAVAAGVLLTAISSWAHRQDINGMVWHWVGEHVRAFHAQVIVPSIGKNVRVLRLVVDDEQQKNFWHYLIDPVTLIPSALPMLRSLLNPSVQGYEVLVVGNPDIERRLLEPGVVTYRLKPQLAFEEYQAD